MAQKRRSFRRWPQRWKPAAKIGSAWLMSERILQDTNGLLLAAVAHQGVGVLEWVNGCHVACKVW